MSQGVPCSFCGHRVVRCVAGPRTFICGPCVRAALLARPPDGGAATRCSYCGRREDLVVVGLGAGALVSSGGEPPAFAGEDGLPAICNTCLGYARDIVGE
ncbi:MAG TPA: hypothetical protein VHE35_31765 [Kofleriaceae bacterium]|nr:hypothetical protein [Kofleriaceae bacterium]